MKKLFVSIFLLVIAFLCACSYRPSTSKYLKEFEKIEHGYTFEFDFEQQITKYELSSRDSWETLKIFFGYKISVDESTLKLTLYSNSKYDIMQGEGVGVEDFKDIWLIVYLEDDTVFVYKVK